MKFLTYLSQVRAEMKHVVWPDTRTAIAHTVLVIVIGALVAVIIALLDAGFTYGVETFILGF
ncbi:MAG: preprotein translocase subunit SecE [Candidatus Pacebacteria bacterium]|nr:preprotein translocase subunit SecE [Candidatus Paceibacterota bacterium]MBP9840047.1 preprotein translocase subunit SecE [Candidatus Paceibacterota bacterium]